MSLQRTDGTFLMNLFEETSWQVRGICQDLEVNEFFDKYEEDKEVAASTDKICINCPVIKQCFEYGTNTMSWGVWGGVYLSDGKPDNMKNAHKTLETWNKIIEKIG